MIHSKRKSLKDFAGLYLRGIAMGAADLVPGVSGGTIALITGIYDELLGSISAIHPRMVVGIFKGEWKSTWTAINGNFLLVLAMGIGTSVIGLSSLLHHLLEEHNTLLYCFFFGLVFASIPFVGREIKSRNLQAALAFIIGTAVAFAFYILVTRGLSQKIHPVSMQFYTGLLASLMCMPLMILAQGSGSELFDPVWPVGIAWLWLLGVGFFATLSHMMMTYALSLAPSTTLAPLQYLELPVATVFGYLVFHDFPNVLSLSGIAIIMGSGLYMIHRERVTARKSITERAAPPI